MINTSNEFKEYFDSLSKDKREILEQMRKVIKEVAPQAIEKMGYGIPEFNLNGPLVYIAAFKDHVGFYPTSSGIKNFEDELAEYKHSKGTIQFPVDKPIPYDLIRRITEYRLKENLSKK